MDSMSIESMVKDGVFGSNDMGFGEYIILINFEFKDFCD
jgi:hypothetical protein